MIRNWCCSFIMCSYETVFWLPSFLSSAVVLRLTSKRLERFLLPLVYLWDCILQQFTPLPGITLYNIEVSPCAHRICITLLEKGMKFQKVSCDVQMCVHFGRTGNHFGRTGNHFGRTGNVPLSVLHHLTFFGISWRKRNPHCHWCFDWTTLTTVLVLVQNTITCQYIGVE